MSAYHSFNPRAAASRVRAAAKAAKRAQLQREEQSIWDELIAEQLSLDRQRALRAPRPGKRSKVVKREPSVNDWIAEYEQAVQRIARDVVREMQRRPPPTQARRSDDWLLLIINVWMRGLGRQLYSHNKLLRALLSRVVRAFFYEHGDLRNLSAEGGDAMLHMLQRFDHIASANNKWVIATAYRIIQGMDRSTRKFIIEWIKDGDEKGKTLLQIVRPRRHELVSVRSPEAWG
jgi:hypothetical protein